MPSESPPRSAPIVPGTRSPRATRPDDITPEQWSLIQDTGNASIAGRLDAVDHGKLPADADEAADLLGANKAAEDKAFKRYVALQRKLGVQIAAAQASYMARRKRTAVLFKAATGVSIEPDGTNVDSQSGDK